MYSSQTLVSDGSVNRVDLSIEYIDKSDIQVYVDDVLLPTNGYAWTWASDTAINFNQNIRLGSVINIRRATAYDTIKHIFEVGGAVFKDRNVDENFRQVLYWCQDFIEGKSIKDVWNNFNMHGFRITNLGDAIDPYDAVSLKQYQADAMGAWQASRIAQQTNAQSIEKLNTVEGYSTAMRTVMESDDTTLDVPFPNGSFIPTVAKRTVGLTSAVTSVNGESGDVVITAKDIRGLNQYPLSSYAGTGTVKFLAAIEDCLNKDATLIIDEDVTVRKADIPPTLIIPTPATTLLGDSIAIPNMVGAGGVITTVGVFGFNTSLLTNTEMSNLRVLVTENSATAASASSGWAGSSALFISTATKVSAKYTNVSIEAVVTGNARLKMGIAEVDTVSLEVVNLVTKNVALAVWSRGATRPKLSHITASNFECILWLQNPTNFVVHDVVGINTKAQAAWWTGMSTGVAANGKDLVMVEPYGTTTLPSGRITKLYSEWVIECAVYAISTNTYVDDVRTINGEGVKIAGASATAISLDNEVNRADTYILEDYAIQAGRSSPFGFISYWSSDNLVRNSGLYNYGSVTRSMTFALVDGATAIGYTNKNLKLINCTSIHAQDGLVLVGMRNTAQANDNDYIVLDGMTIEKCLVRKRNRSAMNGALFEVTDHNRDAVIKTKYAAKNIRITDCSVVFGSTPNSALDFAPYSIDYVDGFYAENNTVDTHFADGMLWSQVLKIHNNVTLKERFKFNTSNFRTLINNVGKATLNVGSKLVFEYTPTAILGIDYPCTVSIEFFKTGTYATSARSIISGTLQNQTFTVSGTSLASAGKFQSGNDMCWYKQTGATVTALVGTLPAGVSGTASSLIINRSGRTGYLDFEINLI